MDPGRERMKTVGSWENLTLQETNISLKNGILKMIFLFPRWDMLIPWRVYPTCFGKEAKSSLLRCALSDTAAGDRAGGTYAFLELRFFSHCLHDPP